MRLATSTVFIACTLIWGTTWYAITFQLGAVAPEVGVALRFAIAAALLLAWCAWRGIGLAYRRREHLLFAVQGLCGFSLSYILIYHAERFIVSGLVATGYAAMPLVNMLVANRVFDAPMSRRVAAGGALGVCGVALVFWPELAQLTANASAALGAVLTAAAVLLSCAANMVVMSQQRRGVSHWAPIAWSMLYGALGAAVAAAAFDRSWQITWSAPFALSLLYLSIGGSVLAFGGYYLLLHRVGPARAAYVGVTTPIVALIVSSMFESFYWHWQTWTGIALVVAGSLLGRPTRGMSSTPTVTPAQSPS
jgi:drug/metabolite transporter (DMT)-like permease